MWLPTLRLTSKLLNLRAIPAGDSYRQVIAKLLLSYPQVGLDGT